MNDEEFDDDEEELPVVAAPSKMTDELFIKHMNARHAVALQLSGEGLIDPRTSWPDQIATFRAFHLRLHGGALGQSADDRDNTHRHNQGSQRWQDGAQ